MCGVWCVVCVTLVICCLKKFGGVKITRQLLLNYSQQGRKLLSRAGLASNIRTLKHRTPYVIMESGVCKHTLIWPG